MAGELHGRLVLLKIDVSSTMTLLSREVSCRYRMNGSAEQAVNKTAAAAAGADYAPGTQYLLSGEGQVAAASLDTALDALEDAFRAQTKIDAQMVMPAPFDTYDGSLVATSYEISGPVNGYVSITFEGQFDGQPTKTTTT